MNNEELLKYLEDNYQGSILEAKIDKGHVVANIKNEKILEFLELCKSDDALYFEMLMDLTAVDWLNRVPRFDVVYHLYSVKHNHRIRIKVPLKDGEAIHTAINLWAIADWMEREVWDLYGIKFAGHHNMKRILMYDEFKGHPLRKDYPYDKRQPLIEETWPSRDKQYQIKGLKIHRP